MRPAIGIYAIIGVLLGLAPAGAGPGEALRKTEVSLLAGAHRFREGKNLSDQVILRAGAGRYLGARHAVEAHATVALSSVASQPFPGEGSSVRAEVLLYGLDYIFYLWPQKVHKTDRQFLPYLTAGAGGLSLIREGAHSNRSLILNAGLGVKYVLTRRLTFNAGIRIFSSTVHESADAGQGSRVRIDSFMTGLSVRI